MQRRSFLTLLGGTAAAWPLAARAQQQPAMPVIGYLNNSFPDLYSPRVRAFRQGLNEGGFIAGRNVLIEERWAEDQYDQLPALAADLVRQRVAVLVVNSPTVAQTAKAATSTIPIVFAIGSDPVRDGLVASLNRPGGNVTGISYLAVELGPKLLELLHQAVPTKVIGLLINPSNPALAEPTRRRVQEAARTLGLDLHVVRASTEDDLETAFATLMQARAGALLIGADPLFGNRSAQIAGMALRHKMPATYINRDFALAGGLMSYGASTNDAWRMAGIYTARILKGEKPADLPVMQPTKFEFVINLKTAKALGLDVPAKLLALTDEVIE